MIDSFAELLAPVGVDDFLSTVHRKNYLHVPGAAGKLDGILDWQDLNDLLNCGGLWTARSLELAIDGQKVPPPEYCRPGPDRDGRENLLAEMGLVAGWLQRGASLVANDVGPLTPALRRIAGLIEQAVGCRARANLYCSWRAHPGFATHYDTHDVYALHLAGRKTWRIYQRQFVDPIAHAAFRNLPQEYFNRNRGALSCEVELKPGDLLYIPRGWYHDAVAKSEATMHVTFGATPVIGLDVVTHLFERAVQDAVFRAAVPREFDRPAMAAHLAALGDRLAHLARDEEFISRFAQFAAGYRFSRTPIDLPNDALRPSEAPPSRSGQKTG